MNGCPYTNEGAVCDLLSPEAEQAPTIAYCQRCAKIAFRCDVGHWNRAFACFCTQCGKKLEKPAVWDMASANPQRTATFPADSVDVNLGLNSGVVDTPPIETGENLPGILVIDGLIVLPNPSDNRLDAYTIVNITNGIQLNRQWEIEFNTPLTLGLTPVHHGLHLYSVVPGGIQKTAVIDGKTELINNINGVDADQIEPLPGCAPLKCDVNGKPTMIAGLKQGMLLFDFANDTSEYIQHGFFEAANEPMSPTLCGVYVVFTSKRGGVFSLNIDTYKRRSPPPQNWSFSAPVSLNGFVYFEALSDTGKRSLARFDPSSGQLSQATDLDPEPEHSFENRLFIFIHPPLTDGKRLFLADGHGQIVYSYDSDGGLLPNRRLPENDNQQFAPHRSIVVNNRIYSAHSFGLTILELVGHTVQHLSLAMGLPTAPTPVARPIRYGDKLFILCKDRLICRDY